MNFCLFFKLESLIKYCYFFQTKKTKFCESWNFNLKLSYLEQKHYLLCINRFR